MPRNRSRRGQPIIIAQPLDLSREGGKWEAEHHRKSCREAELEELHGIIKRLSSTSHERL